MMVEVVGVALLWLLWVGLEIPHSLGNLGMEVLPENLLGVVLMRMELLGRQARQLLGLSELWVLLLLRIPRVPKHLRSSVWYLNQMGAILGR